MTGQRPATVISSEARNLSSSPTSLPRISLVTPVFNSARYIEQAILSVLAQNYSNLEYFIIDGGSTDGTLDIIRRYESQISAWISEPDNGMYDAINKGFARTTGEIMGWLNANDRLHDKGLFVLGSVLAAFPEVEWITGRPTVLDSLGMTVQIQRLPRWSRYRFLAGANRHIQQESTFWRRGLWERAGGALSTEYRAEGDFELWVRFFRHARLHSVNALIGGYRLHEDSLSHGNIDRYNQHCDEIVERELESAGGANWIKLFRRVSKIASRIPKIRAAWRLTAIQALYRCPGPDWPPVIEYHVDEGRWILRG